MTVKQRQPVIFGEVLFDCFPDGREILGGAPFNVAWHLQGFGLEPLFISRIGADAAGERIVEAMRQWGMSDLGLQRDPTYSTGRVAITFNDKEPSYDIVDHCAYDFINIDDLPALPEDGVLYHGSLALRHQTNMNTLSFLMENTALPRFVDINLRDPWWQTGLIEDLTRLSTWVKLNDHELQILSETPAGLLQRMSGDGYLLLTKGASGAELYPQQGDRLDVAPGEQKTVVDTVGAGDAFSSVMLLGVIRQWPLPVCLARAQDFAGAIVERQGAISHDERLYQNFLQVWANAAV